jgi:hypothetical protein
MFDGKRVASVNKVPDAGCGGGKLEQTENRNKSRSCENEDGGQKQKSVFCFLYRLRSRRWLLKE